MATKLISDGFGVNFHHKPLAEELFSPINLGSGHLTGQVPCIGIDLGPEGYHPGSQQLAHVAYTFLTSCREQVVQASTTQQQPSRLSHSIDLAVIRGNRKGSNLFHTLRYFSAMCRCHLDMSGMLRKHTIIALRCSIQPLQDILLDSSGLLSLCQQLGRPWGHLVFICRSGLRCSQAVLQMLDLCNLLLWRDSLLHFTYSLHWGRCQTSR